MFEAGTSEDELEAKSQERRERGKSITGKIFNVREDLMTRLRGDAPPEERLDKLREDKRRIGVRSEKKGVDEERLRHFYPEGKSIPQQPYLYTVDSQKEVRQAVRELSELEGVTIVEPNRTVRARAVPNDAFYSDMWSLTQIQMEDAWDVAGTSPTKVAVIDSGVNYNHEDLPIDIERGNDYINDDSEPMDDNGHGTHVAGTIGAIWNNATGISGINPQVDLLAIKVLDADGNGDLYGVVYGIIDAINADADVINLSLGGEGTCPEPLQWALDVANTYGVSVVGAAGQDVDTPPNLDEVDDFPSSCDNIIVVGATGPTDERASYSGYGADIDIAAPGGDHTLCPSDATCMVLSTGLSDTAYSLSVGTSMATPHVAGVISLMKGMNAGMTPAQILTILQDTADTITTDFPIGKRLNAREALLAVQALPTTTVTPTPTPPWTTVTKTITWTTDVPATSRITYGLASSYGYFQETYSFLTSHSLTLSNLIPCTRYYYKTMSRKEEDWEVIEGSPETFLTDGCQSDVTPDKSSYVTLLGATGGNAMHNDTDDRWIMAIFPTGFTNMTQGYIQMNQFPISAFSSGSLPTGYSVIASQAYQIRAYTNPTTLQTSFPDPVTISIGYDADSMTGINTDTLVIKHGNGSAWTDLTGCVTDTNLRRVTCQTDSFSYFALFGQAGTASATPTPTPSSGESANTPTPVPSGAQTAGAFTVCTAPAPAGAPDLFQIDRAGSEATLYFAPAKPPLTYYYIAYGLDGNAERFGMQFSSTETGGVLKHTIKSLDPDLSYYFKVRGGNTCMPGPWSNVRGSILGATSSGSSGSSSTTVSARDGSGTETARSGGSSATSGKKESVVTWEQQQGNKDVTKLPDAGGGLVGISLVSVAIVLLGLFM